MAPQVVTDMVAMVSAHPVPFGLSLILFTPPFFPILKFFSPLLISTALFMLALFTMGPKSAPHEEQEGEETDRVPKRRPDGGWMDWVKSMEDTSLAFMSPRAKRRGRSGAVNDENVSILEDASWAKGADFSSYSRGESCVTEEESRMMVENQENSFMPTLMTPSMLFKVDSGLRATADRSIYQDLGEDGPDEDAPELEDVEETSPVKTSHVETPLQHHPLKELQIPDRVAAEEEEEEGSPYTLIDSPSDKSKRYLLRRDSSTANSDADTPVEGSLSLSGKLHQMETLGDFMDDTEDAEKTGQESPELNVLQPTTQERVEAVKDQLENFVQKAEVDVQKKEEDAPSDVQKKEQDAASDVQKKGEVAASLNSAEEAVSKVDEEHTKEEVSGAQ